MKTASAVLCATLAAGFFTPLFAAQPTATAQTAPIPAPAPAVLQLQVDVPPSWSPLFEDDVADALASVLTETFRRRGFKGTVEHLRLSDTGAKADLPLLTISLQEWRLSRTGNADCTFRATLKAGGRETDLGVFLGTQMAWLNSSNRWGFARQHEVADALEDAAQDALSSLYRRIADTGSVPGAVPRRK